jgi:hypothetical protein
VCCGGGGGGGGAKPVPTQTAFTHVYMAGGVLGLLQKNIYTIFHTITNTDIRPDIR